MEARFEVDRAEAEGALRGQREREVHEIVEGQTLVATLLTCDCRAKLTLENVGDNTVIPRAEVSPPDFRLLHDGLLVTVNRLIFGLLLDSVQLIMHAIE